MVMTNDKAANYRLVGVNLATGKQYDIIPEKEHLLESQRRFAHGSKPHVSGSLCVL